MKNLLQFNNKCLCFLFLILLKLEQASSVLKKPCSSGEFKCQTGKCIPHYWVCDDGHDCDSIDENGVVTAFDPSDEMNCGVLPVEECEKGMNWKCDNRQCFPYAAYCNGRMDCLDGSDEIPGCDPRLCEGKFKCKSGLEECIPMEHKCDGKPDCMDGWTDESDCFDLDSHHCPREEGKFQCKSGESCLDWTKVCDKKSDCLDQSDEFIDCDNSCKNSTCSQGCLPDPDLKMPGSCFCLPGYQFQQSVRNKDKCVDVDECKEFGRCSQTCVNLIGSFECSCISGFELSRDDNSSCHLIADNATLVFALHSGVRAKSLGGEEKQYSIQESYGSPISVSYDAGGGYIFWTDVEEKAEAIWRSRLDGSEREVVVYNGLALPEGIAYDWIGDNVYFTDSNKRHIVVCPGTFTFCSVLIEEKLDKPRDLALEPNLGLMFWTDWGTQPSIVRAGMDGSLPVEIVRDDMKWPNGITVDHGNSRIYWTDARTDRIETVQFDGTGRRLVHSEGIKHPFGVAVLGDLVFWSDWNMHQIQSSNKFNGSNRVTLVKEPSEQLNGIAIFHESNQPITRPNHCKDTGCSHICALGPENSFRCLCPVGMSLNTIDKKTCLDSNGPKFLIGYNNTLKVMRFNSIGREVFHNYILDNVGELGSMVYNPVNDSVILSDIKSKSILEFDLKTKKLHAIVDNGLGSVKGMDIDILGHNLYWVDSEKKTVEVMSLRSRARTVLLNEVDRPMDIIIIPEKQILIMALTMDSGGGLIVKMAMNGSNRQVLVLTRSIGFQPISLNFHRELEQIFWIDQSTTTTRSISLDGRAGNDSAYRNISSYGIASYRDRIYWTDRSVPLLRSMNTQSNIEDRPIYFGRNEKLLESLTQSHQKGNLTTRVTVIHHDLLGIVDDLVRKHRCSPKSDKEHCSHICLVSNEDFEGTCLCPVGLILDKNGKDCKTIDHRIFAANTTGDEVIHGLPSDGYAIGVTAGVILLVLTLVGVGVAFVYAVKKCRQHIHMHEVYKASFVENFVSIQEL